MVDHIDRRRTWTISGWSDAVAVVSIAGTLLGIIGMGYAIWSRLDRLQDGQKQQDEKIMELQSIIKVGVLPRTDERLKSLENRMDHVQAENDHALDMIRQGK